MILKINSAKTLKLLPKFLINKHTVNLGCIKDTPSEKDYRFSTSPMASAPMVGEICLKKYFKEVSDQYYLSSCVANAVADTLEAQTAQKLKVDPSKVEDLSRLFIYWNARNFERPPATNRDDGTKISLAMFSVYKLGCCNESLVPYSLNKVNKKPGWIAYKKALQNRFKNFYRIYATGDERIRQVKQALSAGCPVIFGTKIYESFRNDKYLGIVNLNTNDKYIGRHAMVITG